MVTSNSDDSNSNNDQRITTIGPTSLLLSSSSSSSCAFEVYVSKDTFKFNAAHFVAFKGYRERLHGHNYQVSVRLLGNRTIGSDGYLIDFGNVKNVTKTVCKQLNEYFLCPVLSTVLKATIHKDDNGNEKSVHIECEDGTEFVFPRQDVALLPIVHATAEELAIYLYGEILNGLDATYLLQRNIHTMEIIVAEAPGQQATFRLPIPTSTTNPQSSSTTNNTDTTKKTFKLDVCQFITDRDVIPMPCLQKNDGDNKEASSPPPVTAATSETKPPVHEGTSTKTKHHPTDACKDCSQTQNVKFSDKLRKLLDSIHSGELQEDAITSDDIKKFLLYA